MIHEDLLDADHNPTPDEETENITAPQEAQDTYPEIRSTEGAINEAKLRDTSLLDTSVERQQVLAPIQRLPREMIEEIFKACVADVKWPSLDLHSAPMLLTRISRDLRHIALTCPPLWSKISIHLDRIPASKLSKGKRTKAINAQIRALEEWLRLSGSEPLTLDATFTDVRPRHLSEVLGKCSSRWKDVTFTFNYDFFAEIFSLPADKFPLLSRLTIICNSDCNIFSSSGMLSAPTFTQLGLHGVINPLMYDIDWSRLTHLRIDPVFTHYHEISTVLRQATSLVDLSLKTMYVSHGEEQIQEILLPNLTTLSVHEFESVGRGNTSTIAPCIRAPLLESLYTDSTFTEIEGLLEQCPRLRFLAVECTLREIPRISTWLQHLPLLQVLRMTEVEDWPNSTTGLVEALLDGENGTVLCPDLHELICQQVLLLSIQKLTQFLRSAQIGTPPRKYRNIRLNVKLTTWDVETKRLLDDLVEEQANVGVKVRLRVVDRPVRSLQISQNSTLQLKAVVVVLHRFYRFNIALDTKIIKFIQLSLYTNGTDIYDIADTL